MKSAAEQEKTRERENYNLNASERLQAINAIQNPDRREALQELHENLNEWLEISQKNEKLQTEIAVQEKLEELEQKQRQLNRRVWGTPTPTSEPLVKESVQAEIRETYTSLEEKKTRDYQRQLVNQLDSAIEHAQRTDKKPLLGRRWKKRPDQAAQAEKPQRPDQSWKKGPLADQDQPERSAARSQGPTRGRDR